MNRVSGEQTALLLAAARIGVGVAGWLAPERAARFFQPHAAPDSALPLVIRAFAARDLALGIGLAGAEAGERGRWLTRGILADALDAGASLLAVRKGQVEAKIALPLAAAAVGAVVLGSRAR